MIAAGTTSFNSTMSESFFQELISTLQILSQTAPCILQQLEAIHEELKNRPLSSHPEEEEDAMDTSLPVLKAPLFNSTVQAILKARFFSDLQHKSSKNELAAEVITILSKDYTLTRDQKEQIYTKAGNVRFPSPSLNYAGSPMSIISFVIFASVSTLQFNRCCAHTSAYSWRRMAPRPPTRFGSSSPSTRVYANSTSRRASTQQS